MAAPNQPPTSTRRAKGAKSPNDQMPKSIVQDAASGATGYDFTSSQQNPVVGTGKGGWAATPGTLRPIPDVPQVPDPASTPAAKPDLTILGASGTSFFGGLIQNDEYNPELMWRDWILKVEQMLRSDAQVEALFRLTVNTLLSAKWSIEPASDDDPAAAEIASFVESALFHDVMYETAAGVTLKQSWSQILRHVLLMLPYGFSPLEVCWRTEDDGEGGYWVKFAKFQPLLPRTVYRWWVGEDNELEAIQTWAWKNYSYRFTNIPVSKLLLFTHNQQGQNFEGLSILRPAFPYWWYKQNFLKINAIAIERNGVEIPLIHLGHNATNTDAQIALQQGENARVNAAPAIVQPEDWKFEYPRMSQNHAEAILPSVQYCDVMMARAWFEQWINLGSTEVGAYNLDASQKRTWLTGLQAECGDICDAFQPVLEQLVRWNYGEQAVYPKLVCSKLIAQDMQTLADALAQLGPLGYLPAGPEINDFIADVVGVPKAPANQVEATNPSGPESPDDVGGGVANEDAGGDGTQDDTGAGGDAAMSETAQLLSEALSALYAHDAVDKGEMLLNNPYPREYHGRFGHGGPGRVSGGGRARAGAKAGGEKSGLTGESHARGGGGGGGSGSGGKGKAESSKGSKSKKMTYEEFKATVDALRRQGGSATAEAYAHMVAHKGFTARYRAEQPTAKATGHREAEGEHRAVTEARAKGGAKGKAGEESIHEKAARLRAEDQAKGIERPEEVKAGSKLTPVREIADNRIDAYTPGNARAMHDLYGDHQLGAALARLSPEDVAHAARTEGVGGASKAEQITRITAKLTNGRYSAKFTKAEISAATRPPKAPKAPKAEKVAKEPRAPKAAKEPREARPKAEPKPLTERQYQNQRAKLEAEVQRTQAEHFKVQEDFNLAKENATQHEVDISRGATYRYPETKRAYDAARGKLARLDARYAAQAKSAATKAPTESIHERAARLQREGGLKAEVKPGAEKIQHTDELHQINIAHIGSARENLAAYGEHQLGASLSGYSNGRLREIIANDKIPVTAGRSKAETVSRITSALTNGRYSANFGAGAKGAEGETSTRGGGKSSSTSTTERAGKGSRATEAKTPAEPKATEATPRGAKAATETTAKVKLVPIRSYDPGIFGGAKAVDPADVMSIYGAHQFRAALQEFPVEELTRSAAIVAGRTGTTPPTARGKAAKKAALIDYIHNNTAGEGS